MSERCQIKANGVLSWMFCSCRMLCVPDIENRTTEPDGTVFCPHNFLAENLCAVVSEFFHMNEFLTKSRLFQMWQGLELDL